MKFTAITNVIKPSWRRKVEETVVNLPETIKQQNERYEEILAKTRTMSNQLEEYEEELIQNAENKNKLLEIVRGADSGKVDIFEKFDLVVDELKGRAPGEVLQTLRESFDGIDISDSNAEELKEVAVEQIKAIEDQEEQLRILIKAKKKELSDLEQKLESINSPSMPDNSENDSKAESEVEESESVEEEEEEAFQRENEPSIAIKDTEANEQQQMIEQVIEQQQKINSVEVKEDLQEEEEEEEEEESEEHRNIVRIANDALEARQAALAHEAKMIAEEEEVLIEMEKVHELRKEIELALETLEAERDQAAQIEEELKIDVAKYKKEKEEADAAKKVYDEALECAQKKEMEIASIEAKIEEVLNEIRGEELKHAEKVSKLKGIVEDEKSSKVAKGRAAHELASLMNVDTLEQQKRKLTQEALLRKQAKVTRIARSARAGAERALKPFLKEQMEAEEALRVVEEKRELQMTLQRDIAKKSADAVKSRKEYSEKFASISKRHGKVTAAREKAQADLERKIKECEKAEAARRALNI